MQSPPRTSALGMPTASTRPGALTVDQRIRLIVLGIVFWFAAAMAVRYGGPAGFFGPTASILAFGLGIPVCWLGVRVSRTVARLGTGQTVPGIAIGLITATGLDGIGLTWGNGLYGTDPVMTTFGAAWILWGVALFLLFAYLEDQR